MAYNHNTWMEMEVFHFLLSPLVNMTRSVSESNLCCCIGQKKQMQKY